MIKKNIKTIIKGSFISIIITVIGLLLLSLILAYTNTSEKIIMPAIMIIMGLSILIGGIISSKNVGEKGLVIGGIVGLIYIICIYFLSSIIVNDFSLKLYSIIGMGVAVIDGIIGGIIGINVKQ